MPIPTAPHTPSYRFKDGKLMIFHEDEVMLIQGGKPPSAVRKSDEYWVKGIHLMDRGKRRQEIEQWYQRIERWAAGRILPVDFAVSHTWAVFYAKHQRAGRKLPAMDSLIAATALQHQLTFVTRNTEDFPEDVPIHNPWAP